MLYSKTITDTLDEAEEDMDTDEDPAEDDEDDDSTKDDDDNVMYRNNIYVSGFSVPVIIIETATRTFILTCDNRI